MSSLSRHRVAFFFFILFFVLGTTFLAVQLAKGYKIDFTKKIIKPTGLLNISSSPLGAQVFVNGKLATATNNTLALEPGQYQIEIKKEGYWPWQKNLRIEKELVTQEDTFLFPKVPDLQPLTFTEVQNPKISPNRTEIAFVAPLASPSASLVGLWIIDLADSPLGIEKPPRLIAQSSLDKDFAKADYFWSPDSRQIIVGFANSEAKYLLDPNKLNPISYLSDITNSLLKIISDWQKEEDLRQSAKLRKLPPELQKILTENTKEIDFSPDGTKVSYIATGSAEIPPNLIPPVLAASTQKESRKLEANKLYVYDVKEDRNFEIPFNVPLPTPTPRPKKTKATLSPSPLNTKYLILNTPLWFPTSRHLIWVDPPIGGEKVVACEYDGTNLTTIYSGPFIKPFVFAPLTANKLIILTEISFGKETKPNLYSVSLRLSRKTTPHQCYSLIKFITFSKLKMKLLILQKTIAI